MNASETAATDPRHRDGAFVCDPPHACLGCLTMSGLAAELSEDEVETLFEAVKIRRLNTGEALISEGEFDDHLFAVAKGEFGVTRGQTGDDEVELARLGPGATTGELAFLDGLERTATVTAADDGACVIALRSSDLETMLGEHPQLVYKVMRAILRSAHGTVGRMDAAHLDMMRFIRG